MTTHAHHQHRAGHRMTLRLRARRPGDQIPARLRRHRRTVLRRRRARAGRHPRGFRPAPGTSGACWPTAVQRLDPDRELRGHRTDGDRLRGRAAPGARARSGRALGAPADRGVRGQPDRGRASSAPTRRSASRSAHRSGPAAISWHGLLHFAAGGIGFTCLAIACFVLGRRYSAEGRRGWAAFSGLTGVVFLAGFAMVASSGGSQAANLAFTAAVILVWTWMTCVAVDRYRASAPA